MMMNDEDSLPLHAEKAIIGRFLGFQALAPYLPQLDGLDAHWVGQAITGSLCRLTDEVLRDPDNDESCVSFLRYLAAEIEAEATRILGSEPARSSPEVSDAVREMTRDFHDLVKNYCDSPENPIEQLADAALRTSADFYALYCDHVPEALWRGTNRGFKFYRGKASLAFAPDINLQTRTAFAQEEPPPLAKVVVTFSPRWLDIPTMAALPRALLHEYISHVPQGPYEMSRAHPDADNAFAEGWMDYVAHHIHRAVLYRKGPSQAFSVALAPSWLNIYEGGGEHFYNSRRAVDDHDHDAAARHEGADAARLMQALLGRLLEQGLIDANASAVELLYRLSFDLNASGLTGLERRLFVARALVCLRRGSQADVLVPALRSWAAGEMTVRDLARQLLAEAPLGKDTSADA